MREVGAFEAKNKFSLLLDLVEQGEEIVIMRRGKIVARLIPCGSPANPERANGAVDNILARRAGVTLRGPRIKDFVSRGRR